MCSKLPTFSNCCESVFSVMTSTLLLGSSMNELRAKVNGRRGLVQCAKAYTGQDAAYVSISGVERAAVGRTSVSSVIGNVIMKRWKDDMAVALSEGNTGEILNMLNCGFPPSTPLRTILFGGVRDGKTYIAHVAASKGLLPVLKHISEAQETLEMKNSDGFTPFLAACKSGEFEAIRFLAIRLRVNTDAQDSEGNTGVHLAAAARNRDLVQYLVEDLHLNHTTRNLAGEAPADLCTRLLPMASSNDQSILEEISAFLRSKEPAMPPAFPLTPQRNGSQPPRSRPFLSPLNKQSFGSPALRLKLRSATPIDRLIRERCKQVFTSVQQKKVSPLKRLKPLSLPLYANLYSQSSIHS